MAVNCFMNQIVSDFLLRLGTLVAPLVLALLAGPVAADEAEYTVKPGDTLQISVWKEPDLQGLVLITPDGGFAFPLVGFVDARGRTISQLQRILTERLGTYIAEPVVTVSVSDIGGNKVFVIGQVARPGEFIVNPRVDVVQALSMAGGTTPFAALDRILVLRRKEAEREVFRLDYTDIARGRNLEQNIELQSGDIVVVP